jgi:hypothetical protein
MQQHETKRQRLLELFKRKGPIWKDDDHPELKDGAAAWIRGMRALDEVRFEKIQKQRDRT